MKKSLAKTGLSFLLKVLGAKIFKQKRKRFIFVENGRKYMTQRDFERKERYGIRKFTVGAASVVIGAVVLVLHQF